ncbi:MAG: hypothetical protein ABJ084_00845 [Halioglobus sp.]
MLTEESYLAAIYVYCGAAFVALLLLVWWLRKSWRPAWLVFGFLSGAALLLTPAYPQSGTDTLAPAAIVAGFQLLTDGLESAEHALRPLLFMLALAAGISLFLRFTLLRNRPSSATSTSTTNATAVVRDVVPPSSPDTFPEKG